MELYEINDTMKLLGEQVPAELLSDEDIKALQEIDQAYTSSYGVLITEALHNAFILGRLTEKRAQRAKKGATV